MNASGPPLHYLKGGQVSLWNEWRREQLSSGSDTPRAVDLTGAFLQMANLVGANLANANLTRARLSNADLTGADLTGADLTEASLMGATLRKTILAYTMAVGADFTDADLNDADLIGADLTRARLGGAELIRADLTNADLTNADLTNAVIPSSSRRQARNADKYSMSPRRGRMPGSRSETGTEASSGTQDLVFPDLPASASAALRLTIPAPPRLEPARVAALFQAVDALSRAAVRAEAWRWPGSRPHLAVLTGEPHDVKVEVRRLGYGSPVFVELLEVFQGAAPHVIWGATAVAAYRARSVLGEALFTLCRKDERQRYFATRTIRAERNQQEEALRLKRVHDELSNSEPDKALRTSQLEIAPATEEELRERLLHEDGDPAFKEMMEPLLPQLALLLENGLTATITEPAEYEDPGHEPPD